MSILFALTGCGRHAPDNDLEKVFLENESAFNQIAQMLHEDEKEVFVYFGDPARDKCDVSEARRTEYRQLVDKVRARTLRYHPNGEGSFTIQMSLANEGPLDFSEKGFEWLTTPPDPKDLSWDLSQIPPDQPRMYKSIKDNWYLYTCRGD